MKLDDLVKAYVALRDKVDEIKQRHVEELAPYHEAMGKLEAVFLDTLNQQSAQHIATKAGTVYRSERVSYAVEDWQACLDFILDQELYGLLERRVAKSAVDNLLEERGALPPGVTSRRELQANVRRSSPKPANLSTTKPVVA